VAPPRLRARRGARAGASPRRLGLLAVQASPGPARSTDAHGPRGTAPAAWRRGEPPRVAVAPGLGVPGVEPKVGQPLPRVLSLIAAMGNVVHPASVCWRRRGADAGEPPRGRSARACSGYALQGSPGEGMFDTAKRPTCRQKQGGVQDAGEAGSAGLAGARGDAVAVYPRRLMHGPA
jgi:hypothetical protein